MKEETKKTVKKSAPKTTKAAAKKAVVKKATAKTATKASTKSSVKKTSTKVATKKSPIVKKSASKVSSAKKTPVPVKTVVEEHVEEKKEVVIEQKVASDELNRDLILRVVLVIAFTLIFVILIIGFVDSMIHPIKGGVNQSVAPSYIVSNNLLKESNIIDIKEAKYKLSVLNGDYFVYVTYNSNAINSFEKKLVKLLDEYVIREKFYYIDASSIKDFDNKIELANKYLGYNDASISKIPTIIYVNKDNEIRSENIITRSDEKMIQIDDVQKLLDINGYTKK